MPMIGEHGADMTGVESRAQRTALNLERRHVAVLVNALGLWDRGQASTSDVTGWERSKGRGYSLALADVLRSLDNAVEGLRVTLMGDAEDGGSVWTLRRPRGPRRVHQLLELGAFGLDWRPDVVAALDEEGGDFWECLTDAALARAAESMRLMRRTVRVVYDRDDARADTSAT